MRVMIVQDDAIVRQGLKVRGDNIGVVPAHVIETCSNIGCLQSPATWLFVQQLNRDDPKKKHQISHYSPFVWEAIHNCFITLTQGPVTQEAFLRHDSINI